MKILCETQVVNRNTQASISARAAKKATLAVGYHSSSKDANGSGSKELQIIHFTPQNQVGVRYKVRNNVDKMFTKFLQDGKATISFHEPPENLMIKCDPIQLKGFLQTLKLGMEGKESINLRTNVAATTAIPQKSQPQVKMTVLKRSDYPTKGFPKSLKVLTISGIQLCRLTFDVCSLRNLTSLNLSYNTISKIPPELGRLSLNELCLSNNSLGDSNAWQFLQGKNIRPALRELDLSANKMSYFPPALVKFEKLVTLKLNDNTVRRIPFGIRRMRSLRYLHMSSNKLESLPAAFNQTPLEILDVWGNNFQPRMEHLVEGVDDVAAGRGEGRRVGGVLRTDNNAGPLWLLAARTVYKMKLPYSSATVPWVLVDLLSESPQCACGKLCIDGSIYHRAALATFDNVKNLVFSRDRLIYADMVLCGPACAGRKQILA